MDHLEKAEITSLGEAGGISLQLGATALGTLHIDPTLSLLIIQLPPSLPASARGCERQHKDASGGSDAVISCHVTVTAEWLWQLWHWIK